MLATVGSSSTCALSSIRSLRFAGWAKTTSWPRDAWRAGHDGQRTALHGGGALADERDGHRVGAHAVARDAAGGVGRVEEGCHEWLGPESGRRSSVRCRLHRREANLE